MIGNNDSNIDINKLTKEELANYIYQYCKNNKISNINKDKLFEAITNNDYIEKFYDAMDILEQRNFAEYDYKKSKENDEMWWKFYFTEKEIEQKVIRDGKIDNEKLASIMYEYCKENKISNISKEKLCEDIASGHIPNGKAALKILKQQGLCELEFEIKDENMYYKFYYTNEEIKKAKESVQINAEDLANKIYEYCEKNRKAELKINDIYTTIIGGHIDNLREALEILTQKGLGNYNCCDRKVYKLYFSESDIKNAKEKAAIRSGKLSNQKLANYIYQYCKKNKISEIAEDKLCEDIADGYIDNIYDALKILEKRDVIEDYYEKNKTNKGIWYKFYFTEKEIKQKNIRAGKIDSEKLANIIYEYCKENKISNTNLKELEKFIANGRIPNIHEALRILVQRSLAEYDLEKSKANDESWYKFYLTEKEIEQKMLRDGKINNRKLADIIYEYCKENKISNINSDKLSEDIANGYIYNIHEAMNILEKRNVAECYFRNFKPISEMWYKFYFTKEEIEKKLARDGKISDIKLADIVYEYCKENKISNISLEKLCADIANGYILNICEAFSILEERDVIEYDFEKSTANDETWYKFYFTKKEIEQKNIRNGKIDNKKLASALYEYCKKNSISYIEIEKLYKMFADGYILNGIDALKILKQQGFCELEYEIKDENMYYKFYYTKEEIERAKENVQISDEELANKIYEYCKKNNILELNANDIYATIIGGYVDNLGDALEILIKNGLGNFNYFDGSIYKIYIDEESIKLAKERLKISRGNLNDEELADYIYQYCKNNNITNIEAAKLFEAIADCFVNNFWNALDLLAEKGLAICKNNKSGTYDCEFYLNEDDIKNAKEKVDIRNGKLSDEELANLIFQYCKENRISSINSDKLCEAIANGYINNIYDAIDVLKDKKVATYDFKTSCLELNFEKE